MAQLKRTELAAVICDVIARSKATPQQLARQIAAYLIESHQINQAGAIMKDVISLRAKQGLVEAQVTTAFPIDATLSARVQALITAQYPDVKQIRLQNVVDKQVLSGLAIDTIDKQYNATARAKLTQLTRAVA